MVQKKSTEEKYRHVHASFKGDAGEIDAILKLFGLKLTSEVKGGDIKYYGLPSGLTYLKLTRTGAENDLGGLVTKGIYEKLCMMPKIIILPLCNDS